MNTQISPSTVTVKKLIRKGFMLMLCSNLVACAISSEPRQLAPHTNLSPEDVVLSSSQNNSATQTGPDFGLETTANESDSLSNISVLPGVKVRSVQAGGPAAIAGIQAGDIILSIDQLNTDDPDTIIRLAQTSGPNDVHLFEVRRDTTVFEASVKVIIPGASNPPPRELYRADPVASKAGYRTEVINTENQVNLTAARVVRFFEESPLPDDGIQLDDRIIFVDENPVTSAQGLINTLNNDYSPGDKVEFTLIRNNEMVTEKVKLWNPGKKITKLSFLPLWRYESSIDPDKTKFNVIDLWLFSFFSRTREGNEADYSILGLIQFSFGEKGELADENE